MMRVDACIDYHRYSGSLQSIRKKNRLYYLRAYTDFAFKKKRTPSFPSETPKPEARRPPHGKRGDTTVHAFTYPVPTCSLRKSETAISSSLEYTEAVKPNFVSFTLSMASSSSSTTTTATAGPNVSSRVNANARAEPRSAAPPMIVTG